VDQASSRYSELYLEEACDYRRVSGLSLWFHPSSGDAVGGIVGDAVGDAVGDVVHVDGDGRDDDGDSVAAVVGAVVDGDSVGEVVGAVVDGESVGDTVGAVVDGDAVGDVVGESVGDTVGAVVDVSIVKNPLLVVPRCHPSYFVHPNLFLFARICVEGHNQVHTALPETCRCGTTNPNID